MTPRAVVAALHALAIEINPGTLAVTADVARDQVRLLRILNEQIRVSDRCLAEQVDAVEAEAVASADAPALPLAAPRATIGLASTFGFGYSPFVCHDPRAFRALAAVALVPHHSGTTTESSGGSTQDTRFFVRSGEALNRCGTKPQ